MKKYCVQCEKVTPHRQKGLRPVYDVCNKCDIINSNITLVRTKDGRCKMGQQVQFVEWQDDGIRSFKTVHEEPALGLSCIIDPQYGTAFTWLTTPITEIVSDVTKGKTRCIEFKTQNSDYKLHIITQ